ncbi:protein-tyrosine-phosphatase PTP1-like isoform X1 [Chenopodium quinoa]|uniref:protein-tyrosine-phosphatase PTP1-like isoform X1 n=1 Tax=Chenopodium quinoa TaxID=63459 RepID=UPI000B779DC0|nr:protein-tyrosine-phosphatase PTP1-like isoform X1 [Chenopodium quinoa]XP_021760464.1 protein-tyrosine-phosphatase PTP1-like isoform X1 [Chenopodium quinoa]
MAAPVESTSVSASSSTPSLSHPLKCFDFPQHPPQLSLSPEQIEYCNDAIHCLKENLGHPDFKEREFDLLEVESMKESDVEEKKEELCKVAIHVDNLNKNRYPNVLPFDSNRIVLTDGGYINASFVKSSAEHAPQFIATQGPLPSTFSDFWEMVLQYRCPVIVMLTRLFEGKLKCDDYFQAENGPNEFGNISIVTTWIKETGSSLVFRHLEVTKAESKEPPLSVLHIQYLGWPDHGTPKDTLAVREIFRRTFHQSPSVGPILVHCSAGIGRTGTYCTIHDTIQRILGGDKSALELAKTVKAFRFQRAGMVQSLDQYKFCYKAVIDELEELISGGNNP